MSKYERRVWFDQLCELKARYEAGPASERASVCTVAEAIAELSPLLGQPLVEEASTRERPAA